MSKQRRFWSTAETAAIVAEAKRRLRTQGIELIGADTSELVIAEAVQVSAERALLWAEDGRGVEPTLLSAQR